MPTLSILSAVNAVSLVNKVHTVEKTPPSGGVSWRVLGLSS